nr:MAG TPA: hypothetical protein [Caudoviricetes sp.]
MQDHYFFISLQIRASITTRTPRPIVRASCKIKDNNSIDMDAG